MAPTSSQLHKMASTGPIRVAHIVGKMRAGGVESFLMNYYRNIDRSRVQFDFIIDSDSPNRELIPEIVSLGGHVYVVPPYQKLHKYIPALIELFEAKKWPIVHSQINTLSVFPLFAAARAGVPIRIAHSHTLLGGGFGKSILKNTLREFSNLYPTHRMACGVGAGEWLFGKESRVTVVPNAIDCKRFSFDYQIREEVRNELGIAANELVLGHVGRFMEQKNHDFLIDVFAEILSYDETAHLLLIGSGPLEDSVHKKVSSLGIGSRVSFLGQRQDTNRLYQAFDVMALPSHYEGLPVVAIEAQASNLPCLFSDNVTEEVGLTNAARFISLSASPSEWAKAFWDVAGALDRDKPNERIAKNYDIGNESETLVKEYESIVQSVLNDL